MFLAPLHIISNFETHSEPWEFFCVDCMTWRRKDVSLSPLRWQFFCLVLCIAQCNNENKKKSERLQFSTQKQTSARMCWNCFHWNKRLALQHNLTHLKNLLKYGDTMGYAVCTILKSYFHKVSFSRDVFALSFYRSQNVLGWSKFFVPDQKFIYILCQSQTFWEVTKCINVFELH